MDKKFKEIKCGPDSLISAYQHIDNGGYTVSGDEYGTVSISFGFFGYSNTSIDMPILDIDGLINTLQEYKRRLSEVETIKRLKGE
jgi:hypothetical protein